MALERRPASVLDVGTGSGAIALAVADELPGARGRRPPTPPRGARAGRGERRALGLAGRVELRARRAAGAAPLRPRRSPTCPTSATRSGRPRAGDHALRAARGAARRGRRARPDPRPARRRCRRRSRGPRRDRAGGGGGAGGRGRGAGARRRLRRGRDSTRPRRDRAGRRRLCGPDERGGLDRRADGAQAARAALERCVHAGGVAIFPADGLYGLACDPLNAAAIERIHEIKGRDDGKPSAVMYFSPLVMRELVGSLGPRTRDALGGPAPRPGHPGRRQPRAPLSARLPRGPRAARGAADRRPARGSADAVLFQTSANRSGEPAPSRFDDVDPAIVVGGRPRDRRRRAHRRALDGGRSGGDRGGGAAGRAAGGRVSLAEVERCSPRPGSTAA